MVAIRNIILPQADIIEEKNPDIFENENTK